MSFNINKVILGGRIARFFDLKYFPDGTPSIAITLASSEFFNDKSGACQERTEFHRVVFYGRCAETVQTHAVVGQGLFVEGKLTHRSFGEGEKKEFITEVRVEGNNFQFGSKPRGQGAPEVSKATEGGYRGNRR